MNKISLEDIDGVVGKCCSKCLEWKPLESSYSKHKSGLGGRRAMCKTCQVSYNRKYVKENEEKVKDYHKKYRQDNKIELNKAQAIRWWENKEYFRTKSKEYRENNYEKIQEMKRQYRLENKAKIAERDKRYYLKNKEKLLDYRKRHKELNPEIYKASFHRMTARRRNLPDSITSEELLRIKGYFDGCALTGDSQNLDLDHVIPLATGHVGSVYGNLIPLRGDLNSSKNNRNIFEWFETNKQRFELSQDRFDRLIRHLASVNAMSVEEYRDYVYWCHANPQNIEQSNAQ